MSPNDRSPLSTGNHSGLVLLMAAMTTSRPSWGKKLLYFVLTDSDFFSSDWFSAWPVVDTRIFVNAQQSDI